MAKKNCNNSYLDTDLRFGCHKVLVVDTDLRFGCHKTLSNDSTKPYELKQHLLNVHLHLAGKDKGLFEL